jgi:DtxR family Mn-dependent transcriptional regulator
VVSSIGIGDSGVIFGVRDHSSAFLKYLEKQELTIGKKIEIADIVEFDHSMVLQLGHKKIQISREVANNLLIAL